MNSMPAEDLDGEDVASESEEAASPEAARARIGRTVLVTGAQVVVLIEATDKSEGHGRDRVPHIGSLVKMTTDQSTAFGLISGLSVPLPGEGSREQDVMIAEVELLGEILNGQAPDGAAFRRGVSTPPKLGDAVFLTVSEDLRHVYARPSVATAKIGTIHQDSDVPAYIITNDLLGKHFAILGTTGCGKSCATALILHALIAQNPFAHILLLDPHNEYAAAFSDQAEIMSPDNLELPYWMLEFDEFLQILAGAGLSVGAAEISILTDAIPAAKHEFAGSTESARRVTVDTPVPYRMSQLVQHLDNALGKLEKPEDVACYQRLKAKLKSLQLDPRYGFIFGGVGIRDNMHHILSRIFRIPVGNKPITIMDLSGVPSEIVNVVVSILCRLTFNFALWSERQVPITLVCEEAHRYAPQDSTLGFEPTKRALARIAKEGRKYGVSLCLISQRPSELAATILSQCNTIFSMRITNHTDQEVLRGLLRESSTGLMDALPSLGNAEAIAVGEGVAVPMRVRFDELESDRRPQSATADFHKGWQDDLEGLEGVREVVARWRQSVR